MPALPLAALAVAQLFDLVSFIVMVDRHGLAAELNPLVVALARAFDIPGLAIVKLLIVGYVAATVGVIAQRYPRLASVVVLFGTTVGVVGGLSNIAST